MVMLPAGDAVTLTVGVTAPAGMVGVVPVEELPLPQPASKDRSKGADPKRDCR